VIIYCFVHKCLFCCFLCTVLMNSSWTTVIHFWWYECWFTCIFDIFLCILIFHCQQVSVKCGEEYGHQIGWYSQALFQKLLLSHTNGLDSMLFLHVYILNFHQGKCLLQSLFFYLFSTVWTLSHNQRTVIHIAHPKISRCEVQSIKITFLAHSTSRDKLSDCIASKSCSFTFLQSNCF